MRAALFAGIATGLILPGAVAQATDAPALPGFRLLDLENQSVKWQTPAFGQSAIVTYAFAKGPVTTPGARNCGSMLPPERAYEPSQISARQFRDEVAAAFRMWEKAAGIDFRATDDPETAGIVIGAQAIPIGRAFTNVELKPGPGEKKVIGHSLICLNPEQPWKVGFDGRLGVYDLRYTIAHEIGHAIGLDHPSAAGQLMSYRYDEKQAGLQQGDIEGATLLYGPRPTPPAVAAAHPQVETGAITRADGGQALGLGAEPSAPSPKPLELPDTTGSISPSP